MNILITGAQGFIGRFLVRRILQEKKAETITGIGRSTENREFFTHRVNWKDEKVKAPIPDALMNNQNDPRYHYVSIDLNDTRALTILIKKYNIDHVVHLAGAQRDSEFSDLVSNNITATHSLLTALAEVTPAARFILGSSGSVYGSGASIPATENDKCVPLDPYAVTKHATENLLEVFSRRGPLSIAAARIFNVIGPGLDERHLCAHLARQFAEIEVGINPGTIEVGPLVSTRDFVDVRDVAEGLYLLLFERGETAEGLFNLGSGEEVLTQKVYDQLSELTTASIPEIEKKSARQLDIDRAFADIKRLRALGFAPQYSLTESLSALLHYYVSDVNNSTTGN